MIKICGITTLEDALEALAAGADILGFNFYPHSPRYISPTVCQAVVRAVREAHPWAILVGVFVNAPAAQVLDTLDTCGLDLAQLSGDEPPEILEQLGERAFKAFRPRSQDELESLLRIYPLRREGPAALVDAMKPGLYGGSGQMANWRAAAWLAQRAPILLAGGLTPENVAMAIAQVQPWGVDVASGVEAAPGRKDKIRLRAFVQQVRKAYVALSTINQGDEL